MVHFVGAGPGAVDLITVRGQRLLSTADIVVYAGSLVNPDLLQWLKHDCEVYNSATMTLEDVIAVLVAGARAQKAVVRLHTGDPSLYGAIREQIDLLTESGIECNVVPGVSSFCAAAAALQAEYTLPDVSQSLIITRLAGRTPVPPAEDIAELAKHQASMVVFLSTGMLEELSTKLQQGYAPQTPVALVYKASWPDQQIVRTTVSMLATDARQAGINKTALVLVGGFMGDDYQRSRLYHPQFSHEFREGVLTP